jgi:hypothetical protein
LLLAARGELERLGLPCPTATQVLAATGAGRSRAYEFAASLVGLLPTLQRPAGRPSHEAAASSAAARGDPSAQAVRLATLRFERAHPGCVNAGSERGHYSSTFRRHVLSLRHEHPALAIEDFAEAIDVPLGTVKDWLSPPADALDGTESQSPTTGTETDAGRRSSGGLWTETVCTEWARWCGTFVAFCDHIQQHCRVPLRRAAIAAILEACGERLRCRRTGRSPDEEALRGTFETFFAGAQWVGDGKTVTVQVDQELLCFNLELMVDAHTDAFVGAAVSDTEDARAVADAFASGVETTGDSPIAVLLDNRPSNHTAEVDAALADTLRIRATPARPQNKAHVEGAFGLFSQVMPELVIALTSPRDVAHQLLELVVRVWACTVNHRPRRNRQGRSRADLYQERPSGKQIAEALGALQDRQRRQELARQTQLTRQDSLTRQLIDEAFDRLGLQDPEHHFRAALARHGREAVVEGIAIFEGKRSVGTLPNGVDARYLLGIVANVARDNELCAITEELLDARLRAHDSTLDSLVAELATTSATHTAPAARLSHLVDRAADAPRKLDRIFWLRAAADALIAASDSATARADWIRFSAARIHAALHLSPRDRADMIRFLARRALPVE